MIPFKDYILLNENILTGVRPSILGLTTTATLPATPPYGFWVDRSGNYKDITSFASGGHAQAAKEILMNAFNYRDETGQLDAAAEREFERTIATGFNSLYRILHEVNYMHVRKGGDAYFFYGDNITVSQQRFIKNLKETYNMSAERVYEIL
jgi:20S proteasome alpha/beta subunit